MTSFHELYERYARDVHRFAVYLSGDFALADDITSETFLRAWSGAAPIREATVKAYLFTIARNLYLQELRSRARHAPLDETLPSTAPGHDRLTEQQHALAAVLRALGTLPERDRTALLMRAREGLPYEQIAQALQLSVSAAKVKVHRARLKLAALVPKEILS
jgi:RNA polymerase sigma-70 factor (ECF subfamily)